RHFHQAHSPSRAEFLMDGELLARFVATHDEAAFAALIQRHGPMVFRVCRRILHHTQDAEDAYQAAFLVLARKAKSISHRQALAAWLHRVAYRIARELKGANDRRRMREVQVEDLPHPTVPAHEPKDWKPWLDLELDRLPRKFRLPIILCDLEGRSRK